jgi:hypothetical protein
MTTTRRICEQPIETPDATEGAPPVEHRQCREEPTYQSDLRNLIALACAGAKEADRPEETDASDASLNVEEAVRLTEALLPAQQAAPRRRLRVAALPLLALACAGVVVQGSQLVRDASTLPPPAETSAPATASVEDVAAPLAATSAATAEPEPHRDPEGSARPPTPALTVQPILARSPPAAASRPRTAAFRASTSTPVLSVTTASEPPSLMQAITEAVRSGHSPADHR